MANPCVDSNYFDIDPSTGALTLVPGSMGLRTVIRYLEVGTHQFEKANFPWLSRIIVEVQAGGGGSAGAQAAAGQCDVTAGGAGGGYSKSIVEAASLGASEIVTVGAGGTAGGPLTSGGDGGGSSFGAWATANGGFGSNKILTPGTTPTATSGVGGPLAGVGNIVAAGGGGSHPAIRQSGVDGVSGNGGDSFYGTGGIGRASTGSNPGRGQGGGAGGAIVLGAGSQNGSEGQQGSVIVYLYG